MSQHTQGGAFAPIWEHLGYLGDLMAAAGIDAGSREGGVTYALWLSIEKIVDDLGCYEDLITNIKVGEASSEPEAWQAALSIVQLAQYECLGQEEELREAAQYQVARRIQEDLARVASLEALLDVLACYSDEDWHFVREDEQVAAALRQAFDRLGIEPDTVHERPETATVADRFQPFAPPSSSAMDILHTFASELGWNTDTMLTILVEYVDNQQGQNALHDYLLQRAAIELEGQS